MNTVVIIVENDVLAKPLYFGKSGDLAIIDFFLRNNWETILVRSHDMQSKNTLPTHGFKVENRDYSETFYQSMLNECHNIMNGKTPGTNAEELGVSLSFSDALLANHPDFLLISRAMPNSINNSFIINFNALAAKAKYVPQSMEEIGLYRDKVIPYLLQNDTTNIDMLYKLYSPDCTIFKTHIQDNFTTLSLNTTIIDISNPFDENYKNISSIEGKICIKPFNLFGGIGVKVFESANQVEEIMEHLQTINEYFDKYGVKEQKLALIQKAVLHPKFGDARALFSFGTFLGAFVKCEEHGQIHNTMYGGVITSICNAEMQFNQNFEEKYRKPFMHAIKQLEKLNYESSFLRNEFICGYDLLLTKDDHELAFKMTESNLPCPTGFPFLDCSNITSESIDIDINTVKDYFKRNPRIIDITMEALINRL